MITNMDSTKKKLLEKKIRPTFQRLKILEFVDKNRCHPTVDMIYKSLSSEIPTISRTTIYNTLRDFIDQGLVYPVTITGTEVRFDADTEFHHHFLCDKCGSIIDVPITACGKTAKEICGHKIRETHSYFKGLCENCLIKGERNG